MSDRTLNQEWIRERIRAVSERYDVYDALVEEGIELGDRNMTVQVRCPLPGHGPDNTPSARYYAAGESGKPYFYCFKCKGRFDGIGMLARLRGMEFMRVLSELERRLGIKIPLRPEVKLHIPIDKNSSYESEAWSDVSRVMTMLEKKLVRCREKVSLLEFVKWCRVIDAVRWDLSQCGGKATPEMVQILVKLNGIMSVVGQDADL